MSITKTVAGLAFITVATALIAGSLMSLGRDRAAAAATITADRHLPTFDRVHLNGAFSATIVVGRAQRVKISAPPDTLARVTTNVEDGTLEVGMKDGSSLSQSVHVDIALPNLHGITNSGAGSMTISGIHDDITIENAGAGAITASGHAQTATISLAGVGKIDASGLAARDVTADNDGVGSVSVRGTGHLALTVNGVGEIRYAGSPLHVESRVNGIGRISPD